MAWITSQTGSRDWTNELIARAEQGVLSWEAIARGALTYMSEDDVKDMAQSEELVEDPDDEDDEDDEEGDCFEPDPEFEEAYEKGEEPKSCRICTYWSDTMGKCLIGREPKGE